MSIFVNIKRLFKQSAVYGIGHIVSRSINFLMLPLYTNLLPRDDYGVVGLMFTYIAILTIIYTYGLDAAFFRFYILDDDSHNRTKIFSTAFILLALSSVLFSALLFFCSAGIARTIFTPHVRQLGIDLPKLIRLASGILMFDSIAFLPFLILRAEERPRSFITYKILNVLINTSSNIFCLGVLKLGIEGIFIANLAASGLTLLMLVPLTASRLGFCFSTSLLKDFFAFGLPYIPSNLALVIMDTIDRPFLERLSGIETTGLYNAGVKLGMFMSLFVAAFRFAWNPFFLTTLKQENAKATFAKVFTYVLLACFTVFLLFTLFIDNIAHFSIRGFSVVGKEFWPSTRIVPLIFLAYIFYAAYLNFLIGIYLHKKTKYLPYITIAGMLGNVVANYTLIPEIGMMGAACARLVAYVIMALALYVVAIRLYPVRYEWIRIVKLFLVVAVLFTVDHLVDFNIIGKAVLFFALPLCLFAVGFFEGAEKDKIRILFGGGKR